MSALYAAVRRFFVRVEMTEGAPPPRPPENGLLDLPRPAPIERASASPPNSDELDFDLLRFAIVSTAVFAFGRWSGEI